MTKFYVYVMRDPSNTKFNLYVDETNMEEFVRRHFRPAQMQYSGVMVEADDRPHAHKIYQSLEEEGEIFWTDEPTETALKRRQFDIVKSSLDKSQHLGLQLAIGQLTKRLAADFISINKQFSLMARLVRSVTQDNPEMAVEEIYDKLKEKYIEQIKQFEYRANPGPDDGSPTPS